MKARVVQRPTLLTVSWCFLFPPRPPRKTIHVLPKNVSPSVFPSPVCRPKDRFPGQSPSGIQVQRTPAQGFTPNTLTRPRADTVKSTHLKPSFHRTGTTTVPGPKPECDPRYQRIPLLAPPRATSFKTRSKTNRTNIPPPNAMRSRVRAMSQDYPLTGPSPGAYQHTYPSSLPPVRGNLLSILQ